MVDKKSQGNSKQEKPSMPEGFQPVTSNREAGWVKAEPGTVVYGELLGVYERKGDQSGRYYQFRLIQPVTAMVPDAQGQYVPKVCGSGEMVNVDVREDLVDLEKYIPTPHIAWIHFKEKIPVKGGRTFWIVEAAVKPKDGFGDLPF